MPFLHSSNLAEQKKNNTQFVGADYTNQFRTRGRRLTDTPQTCESFFYRLTITETRDLIDIVGKLQNNYRVSSILPIFHQLENLLKISGISVGVYDSKSKQNKYIVGTITKDITSEFELHLKTQISLHSLSSVHDRSFVFYGYHDNRFCTYLYFKQESNYLTHGQRHILKFLLPYFYSSTYRLFQISNEFTELNFTNREQEVMEWIKEGKDNWTIGKILGISERTIKFHTCNIFKKLGVNSRIEAICWYFSFMSSVKNTLFKEDKKVSRGVI
jgi:DNA-binding CsgD family transcriptional regulator